MKDVKTWLLIGALIVICCLVTCNGCLQKRLHEACDSNVSVRVDTLTKKDSIPYPVYVDKPVPYKVSVADPKLLAVIDSLKATGAAKDSLLACYETREYREVFVDDSSALIEVYSTVRGNELQDQHIQFQNRRPALIRETVTVTKEKELRARLYAGGSLTNIGPTWGVGPSATFIPKSDLWAIDLNTDMVNGIYMGSFKPKITLFQKRGQGKVRGF